MRATVGFLVLVIAAVACRPANQSAAPVKAATIGGFLTPESVKWDSAQDVYFVSNINGNPGAKDNNGYISVVGPAGMVRDSAFVGGGKNGITLNAPKGMAIVGDTLWVADIDAVRGFNTHTGAPVATVSVPSAVFLNDIGAGPDGALYITDTGIRFTAQGMEHPGPDRVFRIAPNRSVSVALAGHMLAAPNGIAWDAANNRFLIAPFAGPDILAWKPGETAPIIIAKGPGGYDGIELAGKDIWVSSWADSSVYRWRDSTGVRAITGVPSPADIGYDAKRNRIIIPVLSANRIEIWQLQ
jgi:sugar lactone lactonase YvrE